MLAPGARRGDEEGYQGAAPTDTTTAQAQRRLPDGEIEADRLLAQTSDALLCPSSTSST